MIIGYDLINGSDEDYNRIEYYLEDKLHAVRITESVWIVHANDTAEHILEMAKSQVECEIRIFVFYIGSGCVHNLLKNTYIR